MSSLKRDRGALERSSVGIGGLAIGRPGPDLDCVRAERTRALVSELGHRQLPDVRHCQRPQASGWCDVV